MGDREGWKIITTPNADWIPQPYFLYRDVRLRQDGFLAHEDPILWPQLYNENLPYLACVSFDGSGDPDTSFFRQRADVMFIDPPTTFPRKCELSTIAKSRCREISDRVKHKYATLIRSNGQDRHRRLNVLTSQLDMGLGFIVRFQGMYLELTFRFATLCRLYLEFEAYHRHHKLSEAHEFSMDVCPVDSSLVGAITTSETVCYRLHRMGVPVWLVRTLAPNSGTPCRLIKEKFPLNLLLGKVPPGGVTFAVARVPDVRPIFEGAYDDASYLVRISDWVRDCFRTDLGNDHPLSRFSPPINASHAPSLHPKVEHRTSGKLKAVVKIIQRKRRSNRKMVCRTVPPSHVSRSQD